MKLLAYVMPYLIIAALTVAVVATVSKINECREIVENSGHQYAVSWDPINRCTVTVDGTDYRVVRSTKFSRT